MAVTEMIRKQAPPPEWLLEGEGEGEVAFFSAKRWDRRNRADLIESATPCHDAQVVGLYPGSNPLPLTILAAMSEDYTTAPQHLRRKEDVGYILRNQTQKHRIIDQSHA